MTSEVDQEYSNNGIIKFNPHVKMYMLESAGRDDQIPLKLHLTSVENQRHDKRMSQFSIEDD